MIDYMHNQVIDTHISNVGCAIAYQLAGEVSPRLPAYIYDPVTVDELEDIARITGLPELPKRSRGHALNTHAMAYRCANEVMKKPLSECTFIVQHIGGGCSVWLIHKGKAIDMYSDDDAGFAPERCGKLQAMDLIKLCYSSKYSQKEMTKKVRGNAGLRAHLGTADVLEVQERIKNGDEYAKLVFEAFAYGLSKGIGDLATVVFGKVDRIILTGGVANSKLLTDMIEKRVSWIAPVEIMAGEFEMEALAAGGLRIMRGVEEPHTMRY
jgi:butyrate kinase